MSNNPNEMIPAGFEPYDLSSMPYLSGFGDVYVHTGVDHLLLGLRVQPNHSNSLGVAHGGMLATIVDVACGRALRQQSETNRPVVTISLDLKYLSSARLGDWLEVHTSVRKGSGNIVFCNCEVRVGERVVITSANVFKFIRA